MLLFKNKVERDILINGIGETKKENNKFYSYFENRIMKVANADLDNRTQIIYRRTLKYMKEFESTDFEIKRINLIWVERFNLFLKEKKGLNLNSRAGLLRKLKKAVRVAVSDGLIEYSRNPFLSFKIQEVEPEKQSLTLEELKRIEDLDMELRPELIKTKDMFLFACYSSMRYSDINDLTCKNFEILNDGRIRLSYMQQKLRHKTTKKLNGLFLIFGMEKRMILFVLILKRIRIMQTNRSINTSSLSTRTSIIIEI